jgi:hypothetical protein
MDQRAPRHHTYTRYKPGDILSLAPGRLRHA